MSNDDMVSVLSRLALLHGGDERIALVRVIAIVTAALNASVALNVLVKLVANEVVAAKVNRLLLAMLEEV